jgi:hypothetical protein
MDEHLTRQHRPGDPVDLAAIVLASTPRHERRIDGPERVPVELRDGLPRGFDARSVAVLAVVVAALAAIVGWAFNSSEQSVASRDLPAASTAEGADAAAPASSPSAVEAAAVPVAEGIDLVPGRITTTRSASGGGLVSVVVRNGGTQDVLDASGATVLLVVDGELAGSQPLVRLDAGTGSRAEFVLDSCPSGDVPVVAVVDPSNVVAELDERDNSIGRTASFGC